jgi:hypothetical protein
LSELGWTYAWVFRLLKARRSLLEGVTLLNKTPVTNPMQAGFRVRALRECGAV